MPKVADLFAQLGLKTDDKSFKKGDRLLGAIKGAVVGLLAFKTVKFFGGLINDTRREADELAKMSKKVGISVEALQQLEFAAGISGSNLQQLRVGLQRFARTASDSQRGLKTAKDALASVNVDVRDGQGGLRDLDDLLMEVADRFAEMPDGTKKTAIAMELFGRSGAELIPLLNEGSSGIGKLREEFVELGAQIDGPMAAQFEQLNDDELRVRTALKGIRNEVVIALLPTLKEMVKGLLGWIKANRALIRQKLQVILKQLVGMLKLFAKTVAFVIENWRTLLVLLIGAKVLAGLTKLVILYKTLGKAAFLSGLKAAAGWVLATLPLLLIGALVASAIIFVLDMFGVFGEAGSVFSRFREAAIDAFVVVIEWIAKIVQKVGEAIQLVADFASDPTGKKFEKVGGPTRGTIVGRKLQERFRRIRQETFNEAGVTPERVRNPTQQIVTTPNLNANINVSIPEGADAEGIATRVRGAVSEFWDSKMREAKAATE